MPKLMFKRDRLADFLKDQCSGTWTMADIFSMIESDFGEPVGEVTIRKVVRTIAGKNGDRRWTTWTIYPDDQIVNSRPLG